METYQIEMFNYDEYEWRIANGKFATYEEAAAKVYDLSGLGFTPKPRIVKVTRE